ncbi:hypothetical protein QBC32DRAFT_371248 [Pseudoneurospora amorphoporcata]|uniref:Zn(2)-C6 fungal-type domain-containing protein n=1 Tax=Pseudoneurospora amorphoporcata TaxID=241081 RepID=A0AAN6NWT7_9PEZI|nr:hypothetical protein QBC32DRAFT_371248 [Pseudoneurospora amorphoporcata]
MDGASVTDASQQHDGPSITGASQQHDGPSTTGASQQLDGHWTSIQVPQQVSGRSLRKSCDRCHQQKLRCVGNKTSRQACARCQHLGAECVYNARSRKQANNNKGSRNQNSSPTEPVTPPVLNHHQPGTFGAFYPDQLQLGSFFPSGWDAINTPPLTDPALETYTHSGYASTLSTTSTGPVFNTSESGIDGHNFIPAPEVCRSGGDLSAQLASVCQTLETLLKRVTSERTGHAEQYPVGEVFSAFEGFVRAMVLTRGKARTLSRDAHPSFAKYLDSKQASMAAQCYMLCMRLLVSLSEKMLQNLLASPMPAQRTSFSLSSTPDPTPFNASALGTILDDVNFSLGTNQNMMEGVVGLEDLYVGPTDSYEQAVDSTVSILRVGGRLIGRMEQLLEIPPDMAGGTTSSGEQPSTEHHQRRKLSLPARLVTTTWEYETSIDNKCPVTCFKRYRAAILGLAQGHV